MSSETTPAAAARGKRRPKPAATITATAEQILEAVGPVTTIVDEKWPLGFQGGYWVGKLLQKLQSEQKAIENGRQSLLREFANVDDDGHVKSKENGAADFAPGKFQRYQARLKEEMATFRTIEGARPIHTSDFSAEVREKLKKEQISGAMLGLLSGTPFLVEDEPLFAEE
ncbi:MAG: hypothetical protein C0503_02855 [Gemmatimonas sp.]|nr:hypothetical protein [Gemmatimonas sp.]